MHLEESIDKESCANKYCSLTEQIEQEQETRRGLEFRKTLDQNEVLEVLDRYVFESIVEKVIVGG